MAGKITWFDLQLDNEGKTKGMAVIQYSHPIESVQAISMLNNQKVYDRILSVKMDRFQKEPERAPGELPTGLRAVGMGLGANGAPLANVASVLSSLTSTTVTPVQQPIQPFTQPLMSSNPFGSQQAPSQSFMPQSLIPPPQQQQQPSLNTFGAAPEPQMSFGQQTQQPLQQQPSSYQSSNGFFSNNTGMNNGSSLNNGAYNNPSNSYTKMSPSVGGGSFASSTPSKSFYDRDQATRVILIKNVSLLVSVIFY